MFIHLLISFVISTSNLYAVTIKYFSFHSLSNMTLSYTPKLKNVKNLYVIDNNK